MGTSIAGSVPPLYSSYQDSTLFTYYIYYYIYLHAIAPKFTPLTI